MAKRYLFTVLVIVGCLVILLGAVVSYSSNAHAASLAPRSHYTSKSTITVSPTSLTPNSTQCTSGPQIQLGGTSYVDCVVTVSAPQSDNTGVAWTSSFTATNCYGSSCSSDYKVAILPSQGKAFAGGTNNNAQTDILLPLDCSHGKTSATVTFTGPVNKVKVTYTCQPD